MAETASGVTIYYLPFAVETFLPVTVDSIEENARCVFSFEPSADQAANLRDWFARVMKDGFDKKRVRLKVVGLENVPFYVDADGGLRKGDSGTGKLKEEAFKALERFIEAAALRAGCDPHD